MSRAVIPWWGLNRGSGIRLTLHTQVPHSHLHNKKIEPPPVELFNLVKNVPQDPAYSCDRALNEGAKVTLNDI